LDCRLTSLHWNQNAHQRVTQVSDLSFDHNAVFASCLSVPFRPAVDGRLRPGHAAAISRVLERPARRDREHRRRRPGGCVCRRDHVRPSVAMDRKRIRAFAGRHQPVWLCGVTFLRTLGIEIVFGREGPVGNADNHDNGRRWKPGGSRSPLKTEFTFPPLALTFSSRSDRRRFKDHAALYLANKVFLFRDVATAENSGSGVFDPITKSTCAWHDHRGSADHRRLPKPQTKDAELFVLERVGHSG
jgi:hypothetical protein